MGWPDVITHAVESHNDHVGVLRENLMEHALFSSDELTGFIVAVALVKGRDLTLVKTIPGLLLSGQYDCFDAVPAKCFALAALSPLALAPSLWPAWRRYQKNGLWAVQLLLLLMPLALALFLASQTGSLDYD